MKLIKTISGRVLPWICHEQHLWCWNGKLPTLALGEDNGCWYALNPKVNETVYNYMKFANTMPNGCQDQLERCRKSNRSSPEDFTICSEAGNMCRDNVGMFVPVNSLALSEYVSFSRQILLTSMQRAPSIHSVTVGRTIFVTLLRWVPLASISERLVPRNISKALPESESTPDRLLCRISLKGWNFELDWCQYQLHLLFQRWDLLRFPANRWLDFPKLHRRSWRATRSSCTYFTSPWGRGLHLQLVRWRGSLSSRELQRVGVVSRSRVYSLISGWKRIRCYARVWQLLVHADVRFRARGTM